MARAFLVVSIRPWRLISTFRRGSGWTRSTTITNALLPSTFVPKALCRLFSCALLTILAVLFDHFVVALRGDTPILSVMPKKHAFKKSRGSVRVFRGYCRYCLLCTALKRAFLAWDGKQGRTLWIWCFCLFGILVSVCYESIVKLSSLPLSVCQRKQHGA